MNKNFPTTGKTRCALLGIYAGRTTDLTLDDVYVMEMWLSGPNVRGLPTDNSCIFNKMCRINDPLGQLAKQNCEVTEGALIDQTRSLEADEELLFAYRSWQARLELP